MFIKKDDIFDLYEDGEETRRCIARYDSKNNLVKYMVLSPTKKSIVEFGEAEVEESVEKVICNINDLESIIGKAWMYDDLNK